MIDFFLDIGKLFAIFIIIIASISTVLMIINKVLLLKYIITDEKFRKLYKYAKKKKLKIKLVFFEKASYYYYYPCSKNINLKNGIILGSRFIKTNKEIKTLIFAHEIGHHLCYERRIKKDKLLDQYCFYGEKICKLIDEFLAWEYAFKILKEMKFKFNEKRFWKTATIFISSYLLSYKCALELNKCPKSIMTKNKEVLKNYLLFSKNGFADVINFISSNYYPPKIFY